MTKTFKKCGNCGNYSFVEEKKLSNSEIIELCKLCLAESEKNPKEFESIKFRRKQKLELIPIAIKHIEKKYYISCLEYAIMEDLKVSDDELLKLFDLDSDDLEDSDTIEGSNEHKEWLLDRAICEITDLLEENDILIIGDEY